MASINKKRFIILAVDAAAVLFGTLGSFLATAMLRWLPDCIFAPWGIVCPSCGSTRCVKELLCGNWHQAFLLHPFLFCLSFYLAGALLLLNVGYLVPQGHCRKLGEAMIGPRAIIILSILYAAFGIARMLLTLPT